MDAMTETMPVALSDSEEELLEEFGVLVGRGVRVRRLTAGCARSRKGRHIRRKRVPDLVSPSVPAPVGRRSSV